MAIQTPPIKKGKPGEDRMAQAQAAKRPPAVAPAPPRRPPVVNTARPPLPTAAPRSDERRFIPPPRGRTTFTYTPPERRPIVPAPAMGRPMPVRLPTPNMVRPDLPTAPVNYRRDPQMDLPPTDERRMISPRPSPTDERRLMGMRPSPRIYPDSVRGAPMNYERDPQMDLPPIDERRMMNLRPSRPGSDMPFNQPRNETFPSAAGAEWRNTQPTFGPDAIDMSETVPGPRRFPNAGTSTFTPPAEEGKSGREFDLPARVNAPGSVERQKNDRNRMIALAISKIQASQGGNPLTPAQRAQAAAEVDVYIANRATTMGDYSRKEFDLSDFLQSIGTGAVRGAGTGLAAGLTLGAGSGILGGPPAMLVGAAGAAVPATVFGGVGGGIYGGIDYIGDQLRSNYGTPYAAPLTGEGPMEDFGTYLQNLSNEYGFNDGNPYPEGTPEHAAYNAARLESGRSVPASPNALQVIELQKQRQAEAIAKQKALAFSGNMKDVLPPGVQRFMENQDPTMAGYNAASTFAAQGYMGDYQFNLLMLGVKNGQVPAASLYDTNLKLSPAQQREVLAYLANPVVTKPAGDAPPPGGLGGGLGGGDAVIPAGPAPTPGGEATAAGDGMSDFEKLAQLMEIGKYARAPVEPDRTRENELYALLQGSQGKQEALMQQYIEALIKQLNAQPQTGIPAVPAPATGVSSGNPFPLSGISQVARSGSNLQFSNAGLGYLNSIDPALLQALMQFLKAQQYTAMGQMGTYGELNYGRAGGVGPLTMSDASFENPLNYAGLTTQMREPAEAGLRSVFAQMGLMG